MQASAFGRSDTTCQLAWVLGGFVGIALPLDPPRLGLTVAFVALAAWTAYVLSTAPRSRRRQRLDAQARGQQADIDTQPMPVSMPSRRRMPGAQPRYFLMSVLSLLRPFTPLGAERLCLCFELDAGDVLDHVHQAVDRRQLVGAQVDRLLDVAVHDLAGCLRRNRRCT